MPQTPNVSVENHFIGGLKTEFTGLNFPENACTDVDNCVFSIVGDIERRPGFDYEAHAQLTNIPRSSSAITDYKWNNAGGDGLTQLYVRQVGNILYFYKTSSATSTLPISRSALATTVDISAYAIGGQNPNGVECQFSDGNGYLFIYHPMCDPFYCTYTNNSVSSSAITLQIRDFNGLPEPSVPVNFRPTTLTPEHNYNLLNQGWTASPLWTAQSTDISMFAITNGNTLTMNLGNQTFNIASGLSITAGTAVYIVSNVIVYSLNIAGNFTGTTNNQLNAIGNVVSYSGTTLVVNISQVNTVVLAGLTNSVVQTASTTLASSNSINTISTWNTAIGNYPSNGDIWWSYKNSTGVFDPTHEVNNVGVPNAPAPQGHYILNAFNQNFSVASGVAGLTTISTNTRPRTGTWFAGRVWYTGVDAAQAASGDQNYYTWTESLYFSQIITSKDQFGQCYQTDDPTDENLFNVLPSDGGVIVIQGSGSIYKLFPIQNGMLVFAANGIWFITGNSGIGFTATDYTITKVSNIVSISASSFVNVQGLPIFWNEEGIYSVSVNPQNISGAGISVDPITVGTILSFYASIPVKSKQFVKGDYNPIEYVIKWIYKSDNETSVDDRYNYNRVLTFNTFTKAFYPYSIANDSTKPYIHTIKYISSPGGSGAPDPTFKYSCSVLSGGNNMSTFAEEKDTTNYVDWFTNDGVGLNYSSYFVTGYKLHGQAVRRWNPQYIYMYSGNEVPTQYEIQGRWDYANNRNSGNYTAVQLIDNNSNLYGQFDTVFRRHRIRGHGLSLQIRVESMDGKPFHIIGWGLWETINSGV